MKCGWLKYYNVYINHDPVVTLTYFMARSTLVVNAFEWGKLLKCHFKWKSCRKWAVGLNLNDSEKKMASSAPALGLNTIIFKYVYWYMKQISGERLQDHWSSGFETWHEASGNGALQSLYKSWPLDDFDLFHGKVNLGLPCIWMGKNRKMSFNGKKN